MILLFSLLQVCTLSQVFLCIKNMCMFCSLPGKAEMISSFNITPINSTTVLISWSPPFTPKGIPILDYHVTITNIVTGEEETFSTDNTSLLYMFSHSNSFTVTVIASNIAGLGELFVSQEHKSPLPRRSLV